MIQFILGILIGEIVGAIGHWIEDTYISYCSKNVLLKYIAHANELHHYYPRAVLLTPWYITIADTSVIALVVMVFVWILFPNHMKRYSIFWFTVTLWGILTAITHKWSHYRDCELPQWYKILQKCKLITDHDHHAVHHQKSTCRYAPSFPWMNYILDKICLFRALEFIIFTIFNVKPQPKLGYRDYSDIYTNIHFNTETNSCPRVINQKEKDILNSNLANFYVCA